MRFKNHQLYFDPDSINKAYSPLHPLLTVPTHATSAHTSYSMHLFEASCFQLGESHGRTCILYCRRFLQAFPTVSVLSLQVYHFLPKFFSPVSF